MQLNPKWAAVAFLLAVGLFATGNFLFFWLLLAWTVIGVVF